jgi:hypothetical protein
MSTYTFSSIEGPTGATGADSVVTGPTGPSVTGPTGPSTTGPTGASSNVTGPTGSVQTTDNLVVSSVSCTSMSVTGVATTGSLAVSTNINCSGIATTANLNVSGITTSGSLRVTGVGTMGSLGVSTNLSVSGVTTSGNLQVTGVTTSASLNVTGVGTVGSLVSGAVSCTYVTQSTASYLEMYASSSQTLSTGPTTNIVVFQTTGTSQGSHGVTYSSGVFTNSSGASKTFNITTWVTFTGNTTGSRSVWITKNTETYRRGYVIVDNSTNGAALSVPTSCILTLANGEYFRVYCLQSSGASLTTYYSSDFKCSINILAF